MKTIIVLALAATLLLPGCATYKAVTSSPIVEASIRIAAARVLEHNTWLIGPTYKYTNIAMSTIKGQEIVRLDVIDSLFFELIKEDLLPEEQEVARLLFTSIRSAALDDLKVRGIETPEDQQAYAVQVLSWVNQTAAIRLNR